VPSIGAVISVRSSTSRLAVSRCSISASSDWVRLSSWLMEASWVVPCAMICSSVSPIACRARAMLARRSARLPSISARALEGEQTSLALQPLAVQLLDSPGFLRDQVDLPAVGLDLRLEAGDFLAQLRDPPVEDGLTVGQRLGPSLEQRALRHHGLERRGMIGGRLDQPVREADALAGLLGEQPGLGRGQRVEVGLKHVEARPRLDVLEHDQRIAMPHGTAVPDQDLPNDATLEMLHGAPVAVGADDARRDGRPGQRRDRRPQAYAAEEQTDDQTAGRDRATQLLHQGRAALGQHGARRARRLHVPAHDRVHAPAAAMACARDGAVTRGRI
jgi:hypothetical protein